MKVAIKVIGVALVAALAIGCTSAEPRIYAEPRTEPVDASTRASTRTEIDRVIAGARDCARVAEIQAAADDAGAIIASDPGYASADNVEYHYELIEKISKRADELGCR